LNSVGFTFYFLAAIVPVGAFFLALPYFLHLKMGELEGVHLKMGELEGPGLGCNLLFQSANFKGSIQRAKSNDGSQREHGSQNEQNDTECSGDSPTKVQVSEYR
jgi:hypothetical protein